MKDKPRYRLDWNLVWINAPFVIGPVWVYFMFHDTVFWTPFSLPMIIGFAVIMGIYMSLVWILPEEPMYYLRKFWRWFNGE